MNDSPLSTELKLSGVLSVLCTPFDSKGVVDEASLARLVGHQLAWGVDALVVFGLAGELYKLSDEERRRILAIVVQQVDGTVPVIAGTEHSGTEAAVARAIEAIEIGADALMVYPPTFVKPDSDGVIDYFQSIAKATEVPIIIQDAPAWTGVPLPIDLLDTLAQSSSRMGWVKVEAPPASKKIRALRSIGCHVLGGYGALHLAEDLEAGVEGVMPGCALPGLYIDIWNSYAQGRKEEAFARYTQALPLLVFQMSNLDVFVAVQKSLLHRIGVIDSPRLRRPGSQLDREQEAWLERLLEKTDLGTFLAPAPDVRSVDSRSSMRAADVELNISGTGDENCE
jgi:2-keto-3-deoxy-L-arabinonate dehydratase